MNRALRPSFSLYGFAFKTKFGRLLRFEQDSQFSTRGQFSAWKSYKITLATWVRASS
jgi:hypothetical protein